jgi:iron complex transport system substrate-binding protein
LEILLTTVPDVIIVDEYRPRAPALAYEVLAHPAIDALLTRAPRVVVPNRYWVCGMPETLAAVEILFEARRQLAGETGS